MQAGIQTVVQQVSTDIWKAALDSRFRGNDMTVRNRVFSKKPVSENEVIIMTNNLDNTLKKIGEAFKDNIFDKSRHYIEVDIGKQAEKYGYHDVRQKYSSVYALVPLKQPVAGMKVLIDGRTFVNYARHESGIAVPGRVASDSELRYKSYEANDSMILNYA